MEYIIILKQFVSKITGVSISKTEIYCFEILYMLFEKLLQSSTTILFDIT